MAHDNHETGRYWLQRNDNDHHASATSTVSVPLTNRSRSDNSNSNSNSNGSGDGSSSGVGSTSQAYLQHEQQINAGSPYAPPPRRTGSSLPLPSTTTAAAANGPPALAGLPFVSTSLPRSGSRSSISSITSTTTTRLKSGFRRILQFLSTVFSTFLRILHTIHPVSWRASAHLTDQASIALICYKLYALSITIPFTSKLYYYYLPSCILSDLVAIVLLQLGHWLAFERSKINSTSSYSNMTPSSSYSATFGSPASTMSYQSTTSSTSSSMSSVTSADNKKGANTLTRYLPLRVQALVQRVIPRNHTYYSPLGQEGDGNSPSSATRRGRNPTSTATMGLTGSRNSNNAAPVFALSAPGDDDDDVDNNEVGSEKIAEDSKKEHEEEEEMLEHAPLVGSRQGSTTSTISNPTTILGHDGNGFDKQNKLKLIARAVFWLTFRFTMVVACLTAIIFTVIAVGAYSAGRVVFSWQGAFDSTSQTGYLFGYALTEFPHFLLTYLTILAGGTAITLSRYWIPHSLEGASFSRFIPGGKKRIALIAVTILCFLAICAAVRPPQTLPATDLLIDGITATSAILFFQNNHTHPLAMPRNMTIYGSSNAYQPRITSIDSKKIEHVFFLFLESADELAWPYSPEFCEHRNCKDIPDEYNNVEHFTPFFNKLIKEDPNTVFIEDFRTNLAYTIKAHLASMCGTMPHIHDYMSSEAEMISPTACLPHIVKKLDERFTTGWFQAQMTAYDRQHEVISLEGFETIYDSNTLTAKFGKKKEWTNYFGYSDEELHPFIWDWVDQKLDKNQRIFMATAGATMHHPFTVPSWVPKIEYTKTEWSNNYLNVVKRTDRDLEKFFDNLKARDLLDKSLIIMQGDHGPRIGEDGIYVDYGWWERIYKSPLAIKAPGLDPKRIKQDPFKPFVALDIMPTILDALGVSPSIMKSFVGQSIFRNRKGRHYVRDTFHAQSRGGQYPHTLRMIPSNQYKAVRWDTGDTCATDLNVDPTESYFYCVKDGWRQIFEGKDLADGISQGLWQKGSIEELELIAYAHEAKDLLDEHLRINADFWDVGKHKQEYDNKRQHFLEAVKEAVHWS